MSLDRDFLYLSLGMMLLMSLPAPLFRDRADVTGFDLFVESFSDLFVVVAIAQWFPSQKIERALVYSRAPMKRLIGVLWCVAFGSKTKVIRQFTRCFFFFKLLAL